MLESMRMTSSFVVYEMRTPVATMAVTLTLRDAMAYVVEEMYGMRKESDWYKESYWVDEMGVRYNASDPGAVDFGPGNGYLAFVEGGTVSAARIYWYPLYRESNVKAVRR